MSDAKPSVKNTKGKIGGWHGYGWKPGQSGNPAGRKRGIEEHARKYTHEALECLARSLKGDSWQERHNAAVLLLERGWGKPVQQVTGDPDKPLAIHFSWAPAASVLEETPTIEHEPAFIASEDDQTTV